MNDSLIRTTMVVGASRGLGRGIAIAFADSGDTVVAVSRTPGPPADVIGGGRVRVELADATDATAAAALLSHYNPDSLIIVAGGTPEMAPLQEQSWESFSVNWHADVRIAFTWLQLALFAPLKPGSEIVVVSSGAAVNGSPASGGYAGAKSTQRFLAQYAQEESRRAGLNLTITTVLPQMTPFGAVGRAGIGAYAARSGQTDEAFTAQLGTLLTPELAGNSLVGLLREPRPRESEYLLTGAGLLPVGSANISRSGNTPDIAD